MRQFPPETGIEAFAAIEDPDIREVLEGLCEGTTSPERHPDPEEIPGLARECLNRLKVLPGVELFGDRREALLAALTDLLHRWFFERRSILLTMARSSGRASPGEPRRRTSGSPLIDLCMNLLRDRDLAEISASDELIAETFRGVLPTSLDADSEAFFFLARATEVQSRVIESGSVENTVRRLLDWLRGNGDPVWSGRESAARSPGLIHRRRTWIALR